MENCKMQIENCNGSFVGEMCDVRATLMVKKGGKSTLFIPLGEQSAMPLSFLVV